jgi:hypothetical protein
MKAARPKAVLAAVLRVMTFSGLLWMPVLVRAHAPNVIEAGQRVSSGHRAGVQMSEHLPDCVLEIVKLFLRQLRQLTECA